MKYCVHCGAEMLDEAVLCVKCGCYTNEEKAAAVQNAKGDSTMATVIKVFLILGCIAQGWAIIPLAWCLPITISAFKAMKNGTPMSTGLKVCTLLFVNIVAGICMLCADEF